MSVSDPTALSLYSLPPVVERNRKDKVIEGTAILDDEAAEPGFGSIKAILSAVRVNYKVTCNLLSKILL